MGGFNSKELYLNKGKLWKSITAPATVTGTSNFGFVTVETGRQNHKEARSRETCLIQITGGKILKKILKLKLLLILFVSCSENTPENLIIQNNADFVLLTNDWISNESNFHIHTENGDWVESVEHIDINDMFSADTVARSFNENQAWFLDRSNNSISKISFDNMGHPTISSKWILGNNPNPHDVWLHENDLYVTQYENENLLVLNSKTGEIKTQINLSSNEMLTQCASGDGNTEMDQLFMKNGKIYVSMQCLDTSSSWSPVTEGKIAVIETESNIISEVVNLTDCFNPVDASEDPGGTHLYFSCVNNYEGGNDGSIVRMSYLDHSIENLISESSFGGDIGGLTIKDNNNIFVTVTSPSWSHTWVSKADLLTETVQIVHEKNTLWHNRIAFKNEMLWMVGEEGLYSISDCGLFCTDEKIVKSSTDAAQLLFWLGDPMFGGGGH